MKKYHLKSYRKEILFLICGIFVILALKYDYILFKLSTPVEFENIFGINPSSKADELFDRKFFEECQLDPKNNFSLTLANEADIEFQYQVRICKDVDIAYINEPKLSKHDNFYRIIAIYSKNFNQETFTKVYGKFHNTGKLFKKKVYIYNKDKIKEEGEIKYQIDQKEVTPRYINYDLIFNTNLLAPKQ